MEMRVEGSARQAAVVIRTSSEQTTYLSTTRERVGRKPTRPIGD
jgi:hypothetical protein